MDLFSNDVYCQIEREIPLKYDEKRLTPAKLQQLKSAAGHENKRVFSCGKEQVVLTRTYPAHNFGLEDRKCNCFF